MKLHQWIDCYRSGDFDSPLKAVQIRAGWCDWFCPDRSLAKKTARYSDLIGWLYLNTKIDGEVSFKNCCGSVLYDIVYIGDWLFINHPKKGWTLQNMETVISGRTYAYGMRDIKTFMKGKAE